MKILQDIRLEPMELEAIKYAVSEFRGDVFLIGSRVDTNRRGGDIDILLVSEIVVESKFLYIQNIRNRFLERCEEKIDVTLFNCDMDKQETAFFKSVDKVQIK